MFLNSLVICQCLFQLWILGIMCSRRRTVLTKHLGSSASKRPLHHTATPRNIVLVMIHRRRSRFEFEIENFLSSWVDWRVLDIAGCDRKETPPIRFRIDHVTKPTIGLICKISTGSAVTSISFLGFGSSKIYAVFLAH